MKNRGITLVALVITIIVLLILAGITINLTIGDQGIISRAQQASRNYKSAEQAEQEQLSGIDSYIDNMQTQNGENNDNNYDTATSGELEVDNNLLSIQCYTSGWYDQLYSSNITRNLTGQNTTDISVVEDGNVNEIFTSFNSILKKCTSDTITGFIPGKYTGEYIDQSLANAPFALEFNTNADEMIFYACGYLRISVYDSKINRYVMSSEEGVFTGSDGALVYVDFGEKSTEPKDIRIETEGNIGKFTIMQGKEISKVKHTSKTILFIGDSWTEGVAIDTGKKYLSYSNIIADRLNMLCINSGIGGAGYTIPTPAQSNEGALYSYVNILNKQLENFEPDVIVINGGGNDINSTTSVDEIAQTANALYQKLEQYKANHDCKVVIMGVEYIEGMTQVEQRITELNSKLIEFAAQHKLPYIDYLTGDTYGANGERITEGNGPYITEQNKVEYIYTDNTHPTQAGHKYLSDALAKEVDRALKSIK